MKVYVGAALLVVTLVSTAPAQVDERLAAYTGRNAKGYLSPLVDALHTNLNSGLFHSADIPTRDFYVTIEMNGMATFFGEDSRTFTATTEGDFLPEQSTSAPTVVGGNNAVFVEGEAGTQFAFPGGFNVDHIWFASPQLRVGSWHGTEVLGRLAWYDTGVPELGDATAWGVGVRHSISQYLPSLHPLDVAVAATYQDARLQDDGGHSVLQSDVFSASLQTGALLGAMYPYAGLTASWFHMNARYEFDEDFGLEPFSLDFEYDAAFQATLGIAYRIGGFAAYGEYNWADESSLAAGLSVTVPFNNRSATP